LSAIVSKAKNEVNERLNMVLIGDGEWQIEQSRHTFTSFASFYYSPGLFYQNPSRRSRRS
jgi:hypothetical protein